MTGVVLLFVAPWTMRLVVYFDRQIMHSLLGPDAQTSRVRSLEQSRAKTLDAATETLRRIERNLHDGTQAQLVALAMRLGQANEKLDSLVAENRTAEIVAVQQLVDEAHRGQKRPLPTYGIWPEASTRPRDTGLENALSTLAARSSVPTEVTVSIETRPSPAIEADLLLLCRRAPRERRPACRSVPGLPDLRPARALAPDRGARRRMWRCRRESRRGPPRAAFAVSPTGSAPSKGT